MVVDQNSYLYLRNNIYYFSRRVPLDMEGHYASKRIVKSLKTRTKRIALRVSNQVSFQLETYWSSLRVEQITKFQQLIVDRKIQNGFNTALFLVAQQRATTTEEIT